MPIPNIQTSPTFVPPSGSMGSSICFVGSQPNVQEIRQSPRKPFTSQAGLELVNCMSSNDLARSECYFTYVIKTLDMPVHKSISINAKKALITIHPSAEPHIEMLKQELENCSANIIIAVGDVALAILCDRIGITKWRGSVIESTLLPGRKVIPMLSPATVVPPLNQYKNRFIIIRDLERAIKQSAFPEIREHPMKLLIEPTMQTIIEFLLVCLEKGKLGAIICLDIEVIGEIDCISFAYDEYNCICIPFTGKAGDYMLQRQEIEVWKFIAAILEHPKVTICGQNIIFDLAFIFRKTGIAANGPVLCTMVAQKMLYPDYNVGLDFITSVYTSLPYYKADGKQWIKHGTGSRHQWWNYNARDSIACAIAMPKQLKDLDEMGNLPTYYSKMKITLPLMYMMERGIKVDTAGLLWERNKTISRINELHEEIWGIVGYEINTNSPKQLANYFYVELKQKPYQKRTPKGWVPTTDELALKRLSRKGFTVASLLLEIRGLSKRLGTYLNLDKLSADSRVRCQYKPHGAKTGRLASSGDIFGEGLNQQNWPHDLLSYLVPDEGYIFYSFDLSQIENRIVAYVGRVIQMISAFESSIDLHRKTASLLFSIKIDEVSSDEGSSPFSAKRSQRDDGKRCNHSLNYDFGYKSFALRFEMPERDAKWIVNRYHEIYPEVRSVYHAMVKRQLSETRTLTNLLGRRRVFLDRWGDQLFKDAYAHIPQSTVADKMDQVITYIYGNQDLFSPLELLIQIHDSIGFQIPLSLPFSQHAKILHAIHKFMCKPLEWHGRKFTVPTDLTVGLNLNKHDSLELKHKDIDEDLEEKLTNTYSALLEKGK